MYHKCPICKGKGVLKKINPCPTCLGERIIHKDNGMSPSKQTVSIFYVPYVPYTPPGGGGHKGAAGFIIDNIHEFLNN